MVKKTDAELRADLMEALDAIPTVNAAEIEVLVDGGLVTLNGKVDTHQTRFHVERMARRVSGMRGLQINIRPGVNVLKRSPQQPRKFSA
jgi:osmotically-inducible protein OsmY